MKILGIDPGLKIIGLGLIESGDELAAVDWATIETNGTNTSQRLQEIAQDLEQYIQQHTPDLAVVEKLYFSTNAKTAMDVAQARGIILMTLAKHEIAVLEPTPLQLKSCITGDGKADKTQMQSMLMRLLHLTEIPKPADSADALGLAVFGALTHKTVITQE